MQSCTSISHLLKILSKPISSLSYCPTSLLPCVAKLESGSCAFCLHPLFDSFAPVSCPPNTTGDLHIADLMTSSYSSFFLISHLLFNAISRSCNLETVSPFGCMFFFLLPHGIGLLRLLRWIHPVLQTCESGSIFRHFSVLALCSVS